VEVVEHKHQGLRFGGVLEEGGDAIEEPEACLLGFQGWWSGEVREPLTHLRHHLGDIGRALPHHRSQPFGGALLRVSADDLHPGPKGRSPLTLVAATEEDLGAEEPGKGR